MMLSSSPRPPLGAGTERVPPSPASSSAPAGPSKELEEAVQRATEDTRAASEAEYQVHMEERELRVQAAAMHKR